MKTRFEERGQGDLQEAMREIQLISGLQPGEVREHDEGIRRSVVVGVTSPDYHDGKTTTAIALAGSISSDLGVEVTLIDLDFQTCSIGREYGLDQKPGIGDVLRGTEVLSSVVHRPPGSANLSVVGAGTRTGDPMRLARSERLSELVDEIRGTARFVVCDLPATLHSMTTPMLAQKCDAVVLVARAGHTTRADLERTNHLLGSSNVVGVVLNRYRTHVPVWIQRPLGIRD